MKRSGISSPRFNFGAQVLTSLALAVMLSLSSGRGANQVVSQELPAAQTLEREMTGAETHRYQVDLKANEFLQVRVEQKGIDVVLKLLDVNAKVLATMDSPNGTQGPEVLSFVAEKPGGLVLEVSSLDPKAGKGNYSIHREASRHATAQDRRRVAVERVFVAAVQAVDKKDQSEATLAQVEEALKGWQEVADAYLVEKTLRMKAQLLFNQGNRLLSEGTPQSALAARAKCQEALESYRDVYTKLANQPLNETLSQSEKTEGQALMKAYEVFTIDKIATSYHLVKEWQEDVNYKQLALTAIAEMRANVQLRASRVFAALRELKLTEASELASIASILSTYLNKARESLDYFNRAISVCEDIQKDESDGTRARLQAAVASEGMAQAYLMLDDRSKAIESFKRSRSFFQTVPDQQSQEVDSLFQLGMVYASQLDYEKAMHNYQEASTIADTIGDKEAQANVLAIIGSIYTFWGKDEKAREYYQRGLGILLSPDYLESVKKHQHMNIPQSLQARTEGIDFSSFTKESNEAAQLSRIGLLYRLLGEHEKSVEYFEKALPLMRAAKHPGNISQSLTLLANAYTSLKNWPKAFEYYNQALEVSRRNQQKSDLASDLIDAGYAYLESGNPQEALRHLNEALLIYQLLGVNADNAVYGNYSTALCHLARTWEAFGNRRLAIFYGKQAVNGIQKERQKIHDQKLQTANPDIERSYLKKNEKPYRRLSDWLIEEGRLPEAQQVLMMLKEDEYFDFIRRDGGAAKELLARVDLDDTEREALRRYSEEADHLTAARQKYAELRARTNPTAEEQNQLKTVAEEIKDANFAFTVFLRQISDEFGKEKKSNVDESTALEVDLGDFGKDVAALYTIVGDDRYRVILTTKHGRLWRETKIKRAELDHLVLEFRVAVQNPNADPRPLAKRLYQVLIAPVAKDLEAVGAKTLLWSLDGTLRYLPIAALYDGKHYFVEKYANVVITLASRTRLDREPSSSWRGLGLGVSEKTEGFNPLYAVPEELHSIIRDEALKDQTGLIPGRVMLDREFNEKTMIAALGQKYPMVHIASHFVFKPSDKESFLLLGGNGHLTLDQVRVSPTPFFEGVELLVLSACDTATGGGSNGKEVESFAVLAQKQGARAVIATLWPVADRSTREVMRRFYENRVTPGGTLREKITKAEALRKAQLALLRGEIKGQPGESRKAIATGSLSEFKADPNAPWSHPYFWAPFVLIGNWK